MRTMNFTINHCTRIGVVLRKSCKAKRKFERFALPCRWLTAINGNFIARIYGVPRVENGLRTIIWMRMKFHVFRGGGREEMSTSIVRQKFDAIRNG